MSSLIANHLLKRNCLLICNRKVKIKLNETSNQNRILNLTKFLNPFIQNVDTRNAGHSKWQNIRHTKSSKDDSKSKLYNRISVGITKAALKGKRSIVYLI